jgi:hypothetical protein
MKVKSRTARAIHIRLRASLVIKDAGSSLQSLIGVRNSKSLSLFLPGDDLAPWWSCDRTGRQTLPETILRARIAKRCPPRHWRSAPEHRPPAVGQRTGKHNHQVRGSRPSAPKSGGIFNRSASAPAAVRPPVRADDRHNLLVSGKPYDQTPEVSSGSLPQSQTEK